MNCIYSLFLTILLSISLISANSWTSDNGLILKGDIVTMDDAVGVIENGRILIKGEKIVAILNHGEPVPVSFNETIASKVAVNGWIFPGLIDAHNHVSYNFLPLYDVPKKYDNRYQWTSPKTYKQRVNYPKTLFAKKQYYNIEVEAVKYAEVKAITGGVTGIQGTPNKTGTRLLVRNVEHKNFGQDRVNQRGLSVSEVRWQDTVPDGLLKNMRDGMIDCWFVHLAEGIDQKSRDEFSVLQNLNLVNDITAGIHCTGLKKEEFDEMGLKGTKIIWSPLSNLLLYGATTDIPTAINSGVMVSLGTDWSPSGCKNLLGSIKIAHNIDSLRFGDIISDTMLVKMVTLNPAITLGFDDKVGQIKEGYYADLAVFDKVSDNPYTSLIISNERHVSLVVIGGEPLYGNKEIMQELKPNGIEFLDAGGVEKAIDVTNPSVPKGEQSFLDIVSILNEAINFDYEHMWQVFGENLENTYEEFVEYMDTKFKSGIIPMKLDPIYAFSDTAYFNAIANSSIANLQFDFSKYYKEDVDVPDTDKVLLLLNSQKINLELLDITIGLDIRAARNIMVYRSGGDGTLGSADDKIFGNLNELDAITYVGNSAIEKIKRYAFSQDKGQDKDPNAALYAFLNSPQTTFVLLDDTVKLSRRAARNLIKYRNGIDQVYPSTDDNIFDTIAEIDGVKYVGPVTIEVIKEYVKNN